MSTPTDQHRSTTTPAGERSRRALASLALLAGVAYLGLRLTTLGGGWTLALSLLLLLTELLALGELALLSFQGWATATVSGVNHAAEPVSPRLVDPVDVVITIGEASSDEAERSLVGTRALVGTGQITVVDVDWRPEMAAVVSHFEAKYVIDRPLAVNRIGRLSLHAETDVLLWLEAGQVPMPHLVEALHPRFADPSLAVVQSAVALLNADSLMHLRGGRDDEALVREVTGPGRDRFGAAPWSGPGSLIRRAALADMEEIDGAGPAEAGRCLVALHCAGWTSGYDGRGLIRAAAADTLGQYLERRRTRATNAYALFRSEQNPLRQRRLSWRQRAAHLGSIEPHLRGSRYLLQLLVLLIALTTGRLPFDRLSPVLVVAWLVTIGLGIAARRALGRGSMVVGDWIRQGWRTIEADLKAFIGVHRFTRNPASNHWAPTGGLGAVGQLPLLTGAVILLDVALLARALTLFSGGILPAMSAIDRGAVIAVALVTLVPMVDVLKVVVVGRQRRLSHRLHATLPIRLFEARAVTVDLSMSGIGVVLDGDAPEIGATSPFELTLPTLSGEPPIVAGIATVRAISPAASGGVRVGCELSELSSAARHLLMAYCVVGEQVTAERATMALSAPRHLHVHRANREHRTLQLTTGLASFMGIAVLLAGPASAAGIIGEEPPTEICVVHSSGVAAVGFGVAADDQSAWVNVGTTGANGCLAVDGSGARYAAVQSQVQVVGSTVVEGVMTISLPVRIISVVDRAGVGVDAQVRYFTSEWLDVPIVDGRSIIASDVAPEQIEVVLDNARYVTPFNGGDLTVQLSSLAADAGFSIVEINSGASWEPFVDGVEVLPGRIAVRLSDGSVVKVEVPPGTEVFVPSGTVQALPAMVVPDPVEPESTPESTVVPDPVEPEPTPETTVVPDPVEPEPAPETTVGPDPVEPEPAPESTVGPDPVEPEPTPESTVGPDPVEPESTP